MMYTNSSCKFKKWDVWLADVRFESDPSKSKIRPVAIIEEKEVYVLSVQITSHEPRKNLEGEYQIQFWEYAGLVKPSTLQLGQLIKIKEKHLLKRIGRLHDIDIKNILEILRESIVANRCVPMGLLNRWSCHGLCPRSVWWLSAPSTRGT
ncbi:MAG: type II toxin-antitoxin system PemK/MazF family toxin [Candidatus Methanomethylophilaceae archaeon]|nr:type II toxin-antitoxin system PemK/MazF family toxin [Candidatus Methanomethylophilaceae archaeon]